VGVSVKVQKIAKLCAIALTICVLSPISASGYGTKLDNGRDWFKLTNAFSGGGGGASGMAVSGNGNYVYALEDRKVRVSSDAGATWRDANTNLDVTLSLADIAASNTGRYVVVTQNGGIIQMSNDYGGTWSSFAGIPTADPNFNYNGGYRVAMSSSGQYVASLLIGQGVLWSSNYGATFTLRTFPNGTGQTADVAISGDGSKVFVPDHNTGRLLLANGYSASFQAIAGAPSESWGPVAISGDGNTLMAAINWGGISVSRDGGVSWTLSLVGQVIPDDNNYTAATISYDGKLIGLARSGSTLLTSSDGGYTWEARPGSGRNGWTGISSTQDGLTMYANMSGVEVWKSLPSWIWFDAGTVTIFHKCTSDTSTVTSVQAQSVTLILDSATVASDTSTYHYYTETNTALWGATYNYGQKQSAEDCSYSDMTGTMTLARGPFIASSGAAYSETSTIGANDDFVQYIGNYNLNGAGYFGDNNCGNLTVPNLNVANSCDFIDMAKQGDWPRLNVGVSRVVRSAYIRSGISLPKTGVQRTPLDPATIFVVVKAKKALIALAPVGTSWVASETFTVTSA
jgi:photosystem II stability/assembly factor-like uncharacterized protein